MSAAKSSKRPAQDTVSAPAGSAEKFGPRDALAIAAIVVLAAIVMVRAGSRRGVELMPWPDGLEYAAAAVNLDHGLGPVLHFGGYTYPSRYTAGYPLMLAVARLFQARGIQHLYYANIAFGLLAIALMYFLTMRLFGRASAVIAALLLALSPVFITYSTLVLSDVPTLLVTIYAADYLRTASDFEYAPSGRRAAIVSWVIFGLLAGFTAMIRPTNVMIVAGLVLALVMVPPGGAGFTIADLVKRLMAFGVSFAIPVVWQLRENALFLGGAFRSGYAWWVEEVYGSMSRTFSAAFLFGPTMPRNPHGNVPVYLLTLLGLDGTMGDRGDPRYMLYPFAAAVFAVVGFGAIVRAPGNRSARRVIWFGAGFLGALTALYGLYLFTEVAFILPAAFVLFIAAGYGATTANRWLRDTLAVRRRNPRQFGGVACVIALDLMLIIALGTETAVRLSARPAESAMVPALQEANGAMASDATVVSNISLEFLELYVPGNMRSFIGLNSLDPGEQFTDYHLHRLFVKREDGWTGPIPPVLFVNDAIAPQVASAIATAAKSKSGAYLMLAAPESSAYAAMLGDEIGKLSPDFTLQPVMQTRALALYRLNAH